MTRYEKTVDKIRDAIERLVEVGDGDTLVMLGRRYVAADLRQEDEDTFVYGEEFETPDDAIEELSRDELAAEIMDGAEEYLTDKYEVETMAKLYL